MKLLVLVFLLNLFVLNYQLWMRVCWAYFATHRKSVVNIPFNVCMHFFEVEVWFSTFIWVCHYPSFCSVKILELPYSKYECAFFGFESLIFSSLLEDFFMHKCLLLDQFVLYTLNKLNYAQRPSMKNHMMQRVRNLEDLLEESYLVNVRNIINMYR